MAANGWDKIVGFFSAKEEFKRARLRAAAEMIKVHERRYEGAAKGRRTANWKAGSTSADSEIESSLVTLRNRSRQLVRDNPYATKGLQVITSNTVGHGIMTQLKVDSGRSVQGTNTLAKNRETELNRIWRAWANTTACDYDGQTNFHGLQRLAIRSMVEGGECLVRLRRTGRRRVVGPDGVEVEVPPIQLQLLEGDFLDLNIFAAKANNGNRIVNGIEYDRRGHRVAYHVYKEHPGSSTIGLSETLKSAFETVRIPIEEMLHIYRVDRIGQQRGVPWFAPCLIRLRDFDEYEDAQLVRQKIAAMFAVFVKDIDGIDNTMPTEEGELGEKVEPGIIEVLPGGKEIQLANPPGVEGYGEYSSVTLHAIASGLGISYESLTGDLSQVNFSSARMGHIEMGRNITEWQTNILAPRFLQPTYSWFMNALALIGTDTTRVRTVWTPPRRALIDPEKEIRAKKEAVRSGFQTFSDAIRDGGADPEQHFEEMRRDNEKLDELNLVLDSDPRKDPKRLNSQSNASEEQN